MVLIAILLVIWLCFSSTSTLLAARMLGHPVVGVGMTSGEVMFAAKVSDPAVAGVLEEWIAEQKLPVALFVNANAATGLKPDTGMVVIGIVTPPRDRDSVAFWRLRRSVRQTAEEIERTTGSAPGYLLLGDSRLNLGALAITPPSAALVVGDGASAQPAHGGVVVIDLTGLGPAEAEREIVQAVSATCEVAHCVPITP